MLATLPRIFVTLFFPCLLAAASLCADEFTIKEEGDGVAVRIDGKLFTKYITGDKGTNKPYFYPVIGPTGKAMTRAYPMEEVKDEAHDHPHHRSLWSSGRSPSFICCRA